MSTLPFKLDEHGNLVISAADIQEAMVAHLRVSKDLALADSVKKLEEKIAIDEEQRARARRDADMGREIEAIRSQPDDDIGASQKVVLLRDGDGSPIVTIEIGISSQYVSVPTDDPGYALGIPTRDQ